MFEQFGTVIGMVPVPSRKNVVYMVRDQQNHKHTCIEFCVLQYMDPESAKQAIDGLHGKAVAKFSKPMIVEVSQVSLSPSFPPSLPHNVLPPSQCPPSLPHNVLPPSLTMSSLPPSQCPPSLPHNVLPPSLTMSSLPPSQCPPSLPHNVLPPSLTMSSLPPSQCPPSLPHNVLPPSLTMSSLPPSLTMPLLCSLCSLHEVRVAPELSPSLRILT